MKIRDELIALYCDYKRELGNTSTSLEQDAKQDLAIVAERDDMELIGIYAPSLMLDGFMIYSKGKCNVAGLKSKPVDYFIEELYIMPLRRRKHIASETVKRFLATHKGTYGIYILDDNKKAKAFWFSLVKPQSFARADNKGKFYYWRQK